MKKNKFILLVIIIILAGIGLTNLFYSFYIVKEVRIVDMDFSVGEKVGINIDTDALHFGTNFPKGSSMRNMIISHEHDCPLKVSIKLYGDFASWMSVSDNDFILDPGESRKISFSVSVPEDAPFGDYSGFAKIIFKRV